MTNFLGGVFRLIACPLSFSVDGRLWKILRYPERVGSKEVWDVLDAVGELA